MVNVWDKKPLYATYGENHELLKSTNTIIKYYKFWYGASFKIRGLMVIPCEHFIYALSKYILISHRLQFSFIVKGSYVYSFCYILLTQLCKSEPLTFWRYPENCPLRKIAPRLGLEF